MLHVFWGSITRHLNIYVFVINCPFYHYELYYLYNTGSVFEPSTVSFIFLFRICQYKCLICTIKSYQPVGQASFTISVSKNSFVILPAYSSRWNLEVDKISLKKSNYNFDWYHVQIRQTFEERGLFHKTKTCHWKIILLLYLPKVFYFKIN